ncbi:MAG: peptidylprolyl isomerase [Alphaproteobacteria bacterium]|nr:peptidylprolyl isomerase [Alphaproteobacteria bacterium]
MRLLLSLVVLTCVAVGAQAQEENRIAAVVNNDIVSMDDLSARVALVLSSSNIPDTPENRQRLQPRVLHQMIDEKLEVQEARHLNVTVTKEEIDNAIAGIEQRNNMPKGGLDAYLKRVGIAKTALTDQLTAEIAWSKVVRNQLSEEVSISDEEINEAMARIKEDAGQPQSHIAEIYLAIDNPSQEQDVERLANQLIQQIRSGANFSAVAQQFSQSPSSAAGGDIGWVTPSQLPPLLGQALGKMKPGEMSYPLRTPGGYYILYMIDRRIFGQVNPDDVQLGLTEVVFPLPPTASAAQEQHIMAEAQQVSGAAKSCGELAKLGHDHNPPLTTQNGDVTAARLPPDIRPQVLQLKLAEASKPIRLANAPGVAVFMVCSRKEPSSGMPTHDQVSENLARARLDALARRYLLDLRRAAYVDIRA